MLTAAGAAGAAGASSSSSSCSFSRAANSSSRVSSFRLMLESREKINCEICRIYHITRYTAVTPNTAPTYTASPPIPPPIFKSQKKFNGKAKFLFCHYIAARGWGTDQIVSILFSSATYLVIQSSPRIPPISEYCRFFVSPEIGGIGGRL